MKQPLPVYTVNMVSACSNAEIQYVHDAVNLNSGYLKYTNVGPVHYFCTIALQTPY